MKSGTKRKATPTRAARRTAFVPRLVFTAAATVCVIPACASGTPIASDAGAHQRDGVAYKGFDGGQGVAAVAYRGFDGGVAEMGFDGGPQGVAQMGFDASPDSSDATADAVGDAKLDG